VVLKTSAPVVRFSWFMITMADLFDFASETFPRWPLFGWLFEKNEFEYDIQSALKRKPVAL
jgi:hypothetical protein